MCAAASACLDASPVRAAAIRQPLAIPSPPTPGGRRCQADPFVLDWTGPSSSGPLRCRSLRVVVDMPQSISISRRDRTTGRGLVRASLRPGHAGRLANRDRPRRAAKVTNSYRARFGHGQPPRLVVTSKRSTAPPSCKTQGVQPQAMSQGPRRERRKERTTGSSREAATGSAPPASQAGASRPSSSPRFPIRTPRLLRRRSCRRRRSLPRRRIRGRWW